MSDYYYVQPTCPNCKTLYKNNIDDMVCVNDDPEFGDSHYTCATCGKWIKITCHMEFDYTVDDTPVPELPF